jgi:hypothetical protein
LSELLQVVSRLEQTGGRLRLDGDCIRYSVPSGNPEVPGLLAELRRRREEVAELLRRRVTSPSEPYETERRSCQPHGKLFSFIGRKVRTPEGPGTLLQVFADRATVLLDSERDQACVRFPPSQVIPAAPEQAYA